MSRTEWIKEIQRVAYDVFKLDAATIGLTNWEAYADRYYEDDFTPEEALEHDINNNGA